ncbi:putative integral membrane protein [Planktothrix sp. PCC 11201]|uniref:YqhA family protein n=1 Tax=Planktothrix sp. PCC 11201 TaxID=1729650 RepID=UPI000923198C|nr:YqhA family protein [Planktothrix sp. PCC 11201]SKB15435.1 putative integral membrane protein [Planktothrix sp. PCC 11201]
MNRFFKSLENFVEQCLWLLRFITLVPVVFSILSVFILFILGSIEILGSLRLLLHINEDPEKMLPEIMTGIIGGIDIYLIGIVMILFAYGIYELFISKIDVGRQEETEVQLLTITSLDQLKDKILKVIVMVMVVGFFKRLIELEVKTSLDILLLAISILLIATSAYLMKSSSNHH